MTTFTFDPTAFRVWYPAFTNPPYTDAILQMYYDFATCYMDDTNNNCGLLNGSCRYRALTLLTAHLAILSTNATAGKVGGMVESATIDKISTTMAIPENNDEFQWWLNQTTYGQMLFNLLTIVAAGGVYIGGGFERSAFRNAGNVNLW